MYYSAIKENDIANGPGVRSVLFVSGCRNHCKGCFQPETWDFKNGQPFTKQTARMVIESMRPEHIQGLTLLGGDPFEEENQSEIAPFLEEVRSEYGSSKDIWAYTGYLMDKDLSPGARKHTADTDRILSMIDVLVDGPFILEKKNISLRFRGSENQRVINVPRSLREGRVIQMPGYAVPDKKTHVCRMR